MTDNSYLVELAVKKSELTAALTKIIRTIGRFEIISQGDNRKPDLLIYELGKDVDKDFAIIQSLLNEDAIGEVYLTSEIAEATILMKAIRIGVKEFFPQPIEIEEVKQALLRYGEGKIKHDGSIAIKNGRVITNFGSKGGVGTTTVAVNLAVSLRLREDSPSVALVDMNTLFGEIPLFLDISPQFHWGEITKNIDRLDNTFLSNVLAKHSTGVLLLPSPAYLNGHVRPTPETISHLLNLMKTMFDYVIIDGGQSTDDTSLRIIELSDDLLMVTTLSLPCLTNSNKIIKSLVDLGYSNNDRIKVVANRYMKKSEISLKDAEAGISKELFWVIPNDYKSTMMAINQGKPLVKIAPKAEISLNFKKLAFALSPLELQHDKGKKWSFLKRRTRKV